MNIYKTPNCTVDYFEVRDGYWSGSPLIGRFCGNESIPPIKSQSDRMLMTYVKTSDKKDYYGFMASYYKTCGGDVDINNNFVFLESPNFPDNYPPNSQCAWNISYPQNNTLRIINYFFNTKESSGCENDFLEIRDGFNFDSSLIGRYCKTHMSSRTNATGGNVQFKFSGKTPIKDSGFSILVRATDNREKKVELETEKPMPGSASHQVFSLGFIFLISLVSLLN
ncbi:bone morphogenetic protein 1 homolog [Cotesia glomerata]|uniref:CUB domain-containing protein n=1 Tax=Cotesia glomerata TaxID=32391 RepID=A0AAV7I2T1_COTGL|nr:bone morphogenetic protein 1 homolog [Cotesia glomerata]KAH0546089.1 hypothetical protein KQX54_006485 [Cotesia glomerata]